MTCNAANRPLGYSNELVRSRIFLGELCLLEKSPSKKIQILTWISPEPLGINIPQVNGYLLLLYDRQNLSELDLLLGKPLVMNSDNLVMSKWQRCPALFAAGDPAGRSAGGAVWLPSSEQDHEQQSGSCLPSQLRAEGTRQQKTPLYSHCIALLQPAAHLEIRTPS